MPKLRKQSQLMRRNKNNALHKIARKEEVKRHPARIADAESRRITRLDNERRTKEQIIDSGSHRKARENDEKRKQEQINNTIAHRITRDESNFSAFIDAIKLGPTMWCESCDGLFFHNSMRNCLRTMISSKFGKTFYNKVLRPSRKPKACLCSTCHSHICQGRIPKLCFSNGFQFPVIPEILTDMTQLEERLVAPRIPFMAITRLGVDRQCGLRGNVVNVINPINETARILPRNFDDTSVVQLMLMRKLEYKNPYLFETIRPKKVFDAAKYLSKSDLYREENIVLSDDWFQLTREILETDKKLSVQPIADRKKEINEDAPNPGGQATLLIDFDALEDNEAIRFAPAEGQKPISLLLDLNAEALSFPSVFCGRKRDIKDSRITRTDIAKSDARNKDRRCALPHILLYSYKLSQTFQIQSQVQLCLRKKKGSGKPTAGNLLKNEFVEGLVQHDDAYKVLKHVRSSPAYWQDRQKVLMAMIRQLGIPSLFITLSAAEVKWPELIVILKEVLDGVTLSEEDEAKMTWEEKASLIRRDPITCSRYFDYRLRQCNKFILLHRNGIFKDHPVVDFFTRIEFQHRGSPHMHGLFWLQNAPVFDENNPESYKQCEEFIDRYISCESEVDGVIHQNHKHTRCCEVKFKGTTKCRFGMPYPPMESTRILLPFPVDFPADIKLSASKNLQAIKMQVQYLISEKIDLRFDEFLDYLALEEHQYLMAIRSNINRPTVFLKRQIKDCFTNAYNPTLAKLWKANMDVQFILDPYACCKYCAAYVSKSCRGMSELLNQVVQEVKDGNLSCKERLKRFAHVFLNGSEISVQEAAYTVLSMPLSRCSRDSVYINTSLPTERVYVTKLEKDLKTLPEDSTDTNVEGLLDHYSDRPHELENCCLSEFAAFYTFFSKVPKQFTENEDSEDEEVEVGETVDQETKVYKLLCNKGYIRKRGKARVIRFRNYGRIQDPENYYRENVMLYYPWRNELVDIQDKDCKAIFQNNETSIENVKLMFDRRLDIDAMQKDMDKLNKEEDLDDYEIDDEFKMMHDPDIEGDFGLEIGDGENEKAKKLKMPKMMYDDEYNKLISSLNQKQELYHNHVMGSLVPGCQPIYEFVSGGAGVGKSMLIKAISQSIMRRAVKEPGKDPARLKILLCASTGVAAFNIGGFTLHQAFGLPFSQQRGGMPRLRESTRNKMANELQDLELIVIDEISMTSMEQLFQIDERLRQIFKSSADFGGKSIVAVGDFNQLEPVGASWIFAEPSKEAQALSTNFLWPRFKFFELTECMRQKDDIAFAEALNRLAHGLCSDTDTAMFRSREIIPNGHNPPASAIRLKFGNDDVTIHNAKTLANFDTEGIVSHANDRVQGTGKKQDHEAIRKAAKALPLKKSQNLPLSVQFKVGARYMMTVNQDTSDGLVNGAIGVLKKITYGRTQKGEKVPLKVWMDFPKDVGCKLKMAVKKNGQVLTDWVPISKDSRQIHSWPGRNLEVVRTQFAFVPAEAITIHKSQGSTFQCAVISVNCMTKKGLRKISRRALYVAFSRCTSLSGLFIDGEFTAPQPLASDDKVLLEMDKLRKRPVVFEDKFAGCLETSKSPKLIRIHSESVRAIEQLNGSGCLSIDVQQEFKEKKTILGKLNPSTANNTTELKFISETDLRTTEGIEWFSDVVVDGFIKLFCTRGRQQYQMHNFGSYFHSYLKRNDQTLDASRWITDFSHDVLVFPVCRHSHWTVVIADRISRKILSFDSLQNKDVNLDIQNLVNEFVLKEELFLGILNKPDWSLEEVYLPSYLKQNNGYDCGVYVCAFIMCVSNHVEFTYTPNQISNLRVYIRNCIRENSVL